MLRPQPAAEKLGKPCLCRDGETGAESEGIGPLRLAPPAADEARTEHAGTEPLAR